MTYAFLLLRWISGPTPATPISLSFPWISRFEITEPNVPAAEDVSERCPSVVFDFHLNSFSAPSNSYFHVCA